jgi:hypothetical protein
MAKTKKNIHTTHSQCVNAGQCEESSVTKGDCTKNLNIPEEGPIRPKHVVGKHIVYSYH